MSKSRRALIWIVPVVSILVFAGLWQLFGVTLNLRWLPPLNIILGRMGDLFITGAISAGWITVTTLLAGLGLVLAISAIVALAFYAWPTLAAALEPMLNAVMATPTIALIPAFALVWGFSTETRIVTVLAFALPPTILTWAAGLRLAPPHLIEMAHSFGASRAYVFRSVVVPSAVPVLIGGVRLAVVQGIKGIVAAEMLTGVVGIGKLLIVASNSFAIADLYAIVLILVIVSCAVYIALRAVESHWIART
jgi:NitT/TauT family transport system permease protein